MYCHRADGWPDDAEIVERHPVRSCTRRGPAIDLVLDRARENRSQFVLTRARGREVIFWQSPRTAKQARPGVHLPTARASGQVLEIVVDSGEKYPYAFGAPAGDHPAAAACRRRLRRRAGRRRRRGGRAQELEGPRRQSAVGQADLRAGRAVGAAARRGRRRGPLQPAVQARARVRRARRRGAGRGAGPLPDGARSCSARPGRSPRSGPTAGSAPASSSCPRPPVRPGRGIVLAGRRGAPRSVPGPRAAAVRAWAREQGMEVSDRGRIPADVLRRYEAAGERPPSVRR